MGRGADPGRRGRRPGAAVEPQRQRRDGRLARRRPAAGGPRAGLRPSPGPPRRRGGHRAQRPRAARLPGPAGPDARAPREHRDPAGGGPAGHLHGLRPAPRRRGGPHRPAAGRAPRPPRRAGPGALAGPRAVRRRADAPGGHPRSGAGGRREQAAVLALHLRRPLAPLAQAGPPPPSLLRRGWLASPGGHLGPVGRAARGGADRRRAGLPGAGRQRHRRQGVTPAHRGGRRVDPGEQPVRGRGAAAGTTWVEPVLVVDVDTHGVGYERLRQPSYRGMRGDLDPADLEGQS